MITADCVKIEEATEPFLVNSAGTSGLDWAEVPNGQQAVYE
jgi:hypothetical protein